MKNFTFLFLFISVFVFAQDAQFGISLESPRMNNYLETHQSPKIQGKVLNSNSDSIAVTYALVTPFSDLQSEHIIYTNEIDYDSDDSQISIDFSELLDMNNGESLEAYLRDIFVCFHPQRSNAQGDNRNKYFEYINNIITQEATLEHSKALKFWSQMKQFGYDAVAADDFPVSSKD